MQDWPATVMDSPSLVLGDGRPFNLAHGYNDVWTYSSASGSFIKEMAYNQYDSDAEGGSALLPDGSAFIGDAAFERYHPETDSWSEVARLQYDEFTAQPPGTEIGPFVMLYDGTLLVLGGSAHNGLYSYINDSWVLTDDTPPFNGQPMDHGDTPACVARDGTVLTIATNNTEGGGQGVSQILQYVPNHAPMQHWVQVPNPDSVPTLSTEADRMRMVALPSGEILVTGLEDNGDLWLYTPSGPTDPSWRPTITSSPYLYFGTFRLAGSQLNGLTSGSDFGDDQKSPTNYPIVTLTGPSGAVTFARSFQFDQRAPRPSWNGSCSVVVPGLAPGFYTVNVTTNGVTSGNSVQLSLPAQDVGPASLARNVLL